MVKSAGKALYTGTRIYGSDSKAIGQRYGSKKSLSQYREDFSDKGVPFPNEVYSEEKMKVNSDLHPSQRNVGEENGSPRSAIN